jgi:hypothetical protein
MCSVDDFNKKPMSSFFEEAPTETRMFPCPACGAILSTGAANCRYCAVPIDEATAHRLNESYKKVTDAVTNANTFKQSIWLAILLSIASPAYVFVLQGRNPRYFLVSAAPVLFLIYGVSWHLKYSRLETRDKDYPDALRAMRWSLMAWVAALLIHFAVILYALSSGAF